MTDTFGICEMDCPVCGDHLRIPICAGPVNGLRLAGKRATTTVTMAPDGNYLHAHWRTHKERDSEPIAA